MNTYKAIGLMSGTSLDGIDLAHCRFTLHSGRWTFELGACGNYPYNEDWKERLRSAPGMNEKELEGLDLQYAEVLASAINAFVEKYDLSADLLSSHGHTIYHFPDEGRTLQIGNGQRLADLTGMKVINDFRTANVAAGGQGAPLVPIGDLHLFGEYKHCLNLGGIANVSSKWPSGMISYDICMCNTALNHYAAKEGLAYDESGHLGRSGSADDELRKSLNGLDYFKQDPPKSLDTSFFHDQMLKTIDASTLSNSDVLASLYEHISDQVVAAIGDDAEVLVTGGGGHNDFLIDLFRQKGLNIVLPSDKVMDYKEALVFAFLGLLRERGEVNCLASVTGAAEDMSTGLLHQPLKKP